MVVTIHFLMLVIFLVPAIYCGAMPISLNSDKNTTNNLYGTIVEYSCDLGHYYYPNMTSRTGIECMDDEHWNSTIGNDCWRKTP